MADWSIMIYGIIATIMLLILILKFFTKRLPMKRLDRFMGKIHNKIGLVLIILLIIHMIQSFSLFNSRPLYIYIFGGSLVICIIIAAASYYFRKQIGRNWIKIHRITALVAGILVVCHIGGSIYSVSSYQKEVRNIVISDIDVSNIPNGNYVGEYDVEYIYAKVEVVVKDGEINEIKILEHRNERGGQAEKITDDIINKQKINVDAVSGATNSSKVIKKAVEIALYNR